MYRLNDKVKDLKPYDPVIHRYPIHLDSNESFLPFPRELESRLSDAVLQVAFNRYPDSVASAPCKAFADLYGIPAENVVAGNGSDELISVIFNSFLEKGEAFATLEPDFSMYAFYGYIQEARHVSIAKNSDYTMDIDQVIEQCNREKVRLLIFSNPCNPTSVVQSREDMRKLISGVDALVILDEAYMDFSNQSLLSEYENYDNLILLKTCSKALGMAAIRLGFAVANTPLANVIRAVKSPYNVDSVSQVIGELILQEKKLIQGALEQVLSSRDALLKDLRAIEGRNPGKFKMIPGETNFAAILLPEPEKQFAFLKTKGILVRLTSGILRVTCGTPQENEAFLQAFEESIKEGI